MPDKRLIDANALMKNVGKIPQLRGITYGRMKKAVEETPTIDAVPVVHGRWELYGADKRGRGGVFLCTACSRCRPTKSEYCPNCGAKMDAKENDNA